MPHCVARMPETMGNVVAFKTKTLLWLPDSRLAFVILAANQAWTERKENFCLEFSEENFLSNRSRVSVPARWERHNNGQLAACGSNGGCRLAGEG